MLVMADAIAQDVDDAAVADLFLDASEELSARGVSASSDSATATWGCVAFRKAERWFRSTQLVRS